MVEINNVSVQPTQLLLFIALGLLCLYPLYLYRTWFLIRFRLRRTTITAEFEPPAELHPLEISYLFNPKFGEHSVAAAVIFLIEKNHLKLIRTSDGTKCLKVGKQDTTLRSFEYWIVHRVQEKENCTIDDLLSDARSGSKKSVYSIMKKNIEQAYVRKGYIGKSSRRAFIRHVIKGSFVFILLVGVIPFILYWLFTSITSGASELNTLVHLLSFLLTVSLLGFSIIFVFVGLVLLHYSHVSSRAWKAEGRLVQLLPQIASFRQYAQLVEKKSLTFSSESLQKKAERDVLPYAIALGLVKDWRKFL